MEAHGAARRMSRTRALTDTADLGVRGGKALRGGKETIVKKKPNKVGQKPACFLLAIHDYNIL